MARTFVFLLSTILVAGSLVVAMALSTSWGAYALDVSLPLWVVVTGIAATLRWGYLKVWRGGIPFAWYAGAESIGVAVVCLHNLYWRQDDVFPLLVGIAVTTIGLSVWQLHFVLRQRRSGPAPSGLTHA